MRVTTEGIELDKPELTALLAFAGGEHLSTVRFRVPRAGGKLQATATDGKRLVHARAHEAIEPECKIEGDWGVPAEHLEAAKRALGGGEICVLQIKKHHLSQAVVRDVASGERRSTIVFPEAADTQASFPNVDLIHPVENLSGSWWAVQGAFLRDLNVISKAAGKNPVTLHPPNGPGDPCGFSARGEGAMWSGVIMPILVDGPGDGAADEDDEEPDRLNPDLDEALEGITNPNGKGDTKVTMGGPDGKVVVLHDGKGNKGKGRKGK